MRPRIEPGHDPGSVSRGNPHGAVPAQPPPHLPRRPGQAGRSSRPASTGRSTRPTDPARSWSLRYRPTRHSTAHGRPALHPSGHGGGRPGGTASCRPGLGECRRPGRAGGAGGRRCRWGHDPLLDAVDLHGAHDLRHTYATWLEDAGIPARVIGELMGHEATGRNRQHQGSAMGAHYRHTTLETPCAQSTPSTGG